MVALRDIIVQKLQDLPEPELREVLDFVESLASKEKDQRQHEAEFDPKDDPILALAGTLSFPPLSNDEIDRELYGDLLIKDES